MIDAAAPRRTALSAHFLGDNARVITSLTKKKRIADSVEAAYSTSDNHTKYAIAIHECANMVLIYPEITRVPNKCRCRHCPVCQAEKSAINRKRVESAITAIHATNPTARYLFLTLTVRNIPISDLRESLVSMNASFSRLVRPLPFILGWYRAAEVTRGTDGNAHPHFHAIIIVKPNYFSRQYVTQPEWAKAWQKALRTDYTPRVDVRAIKSRNALTEVTKAARYSLKVETIEDDPAWFVAYHDQVSGLRFSASGGILKTALGALGDDESDADQEDVGGDGGQVSACYTWLPARGEYEFDADMTAIIFESDAARAEASAHWEHE